MKTIHTRTWISDNGVWKIYTRCCEDKNGVFNDIIIKRKNKRDQFDWLTQAQRRSMPKYVVAMYEQMRAEMYAARAEYLEYLSSASPVEGGEDDVIRCASKRHDATIRRTASKDAFLSARQDGRLLPLRLRAQQVSKQRASIDDSS